MFGYMKIQPLVWLQSRHHSWEKQLLVYAWVVFEQGCWKLEGGINRRFVSLLVCYQQHNLYG